MKDFTDRVAAITGAGSSIGRALSVELAGRGCHLSLCDIDEAGLATTAHLAERAGPVRVFRAAVDVADRPAVEGWARAVVAEHGSVNLIVNNAGVSLTASIDAMTIESFQWLMDINFWGVVYGTKAFLPHLKASGEGHVVNVSSVFGLLGIPTQSAYNAAKFAVRGFTEALRTELDLDDCGVSATSIHPGGIKTDIVRRGRIEGEVPAAEIDREEAAREFERLARTTPERAAALIVRAIEKDKRRAMIGPDSHVFDLAARLPPSAYQWALRAAGRRAEGRFDGG